MELLHPLFKWFHIFAGIMWIGLLYFFNFVNGSFVATLDGDTKKKVVPELMPRALYWFRWGAAWTWFTGLVLMYVLFWTTSEMPSNFTSDEITGESANMYIHLLLLFTFLAVFIYDFIYKSKLASNVRLVTTISFVLIGIYLYSLSSCAGFGYRAFNIHVGAMFGTIMAFNVWFRIWPAQQKIITAIKNGDAPDPADAAMAGLRSRHNTYLSLPLIWTMINEHHSGTALTGDGWIPFISASNNWMVLMIVIALGWHIILQCYKKAAKIEGF
jgi:uncharacterized membrane protein